MAQQRPLTAAEEEIVILLAAFPRSTAAQLLQHIKPAISQPTLSRRIDALEKWGIVRREGRARATVYTLANARSYADLPLSRRPPATYRFEWLEGIDPARPQFFAPQDEEELLTAGQVPGVSPNLFFQRVFERFLIDLSFASSKMEGNTYTLLDTERLIREGVHAEGKAAEEAIMILNHKAAILYLMENIQDVTISLGDIRNVHALLSKDLVREGEPGAVRTQIVSIGNSRYSPLAVPQQLDEQLRLLVTKARAMRSPFEQSLFLLIGISYLQPFIDVNKRTARLVANIPLLKAGLAPLSYRYLDADRYRAGLLLFYETLNTDGIKAAYLEGYRASATALKQHYEEHRRQPDRIDVAYRRGIDQAIREIVLYGRDAAAQAEIVDRWLAGIPENDRESVQSRLTSKLEGLTPSSAILYSVQPEDVEQYLESRKTRRAKPH